MKILLVGLSHHTAPVEVRELLAMDDPAPALAKLVDGDDVEEAVVLSTCNRVEIVVTTHNHASARYRIQRLLQERCDAEELARASGGRELDDFLYEYRDGEAVRHVLRVASSMDSMVIGEPQILGQTKDAYRLAVEHGSCDAVLSRLYQRAFSTAKRVRNETAIAERPISVARVAVDLAKQIFEHFEDKTAMLVGAGEMIELALQALRGQGLQKLYVANRTPAHARELAERFGASAHGLDELDALLPLSDVVLTCIGGNAHVLGRERVEAALRARHNRPMFLIDIGVPRNVDPRVDELDQVYLYDVDDLQAVSAENAEERRRETVRAEAIVLEEQQRFEGWLVALQAVPTIRDLRARAEAMREAETRRVLGRLELGEGEREAIERLTKSIVNKVLHPPLAKLRAEKDSEEGIAMLEAARALFALDDVDDGGEDGA